MDIIALEPKWTNFPKPIPLPPHFDVSVMACANEIKANRGRGQKTYKYIHFLQDWDGEILETIYSVKWVKGTKKKPEHAIWQMAYAATPTRSWTSGNLFYGNLCGYFMLWEENAYVKSYVMAYKFDTTMYPNTDSSWKPNLNVCTPNQGKDDREFDVRSLRNWPKYLDVSQMMMDCGLEEVVAYVRNFQKHKDLELLQKAGISYLWNEKRILNAKPKFRKRLLSYIKSNIAEIKARHPSMGFILKAMRKGMTIPQYEWNEAVEAVESVLCGVNGFFMREEASEVAKYLQRQNGGPVHYRDYLELSMKMGRDMNARGVLFPKDFCKQFDYLQDIYVAEQTREMEENIRTQLSNLNLPLRYDHKGLSVRVLDTQQSLTEVGNALHNCVGTCGYGMKMANGEIVILAVYWNGNPINCVELTTPKGNAMYRVQQNRGDHNQDSAMQNEVTAFLEGYIREANKAWRGCHASA